MKAESSHTHLPGPGRHTPLSTYRLQLSADFTFADAQRVIPYLVTLGITDLYLSPILQAAPGSTHGYDVVNHARISADLGGQHGFVQLAQTAHRAGLNVIVDLVPNHMAVPTPAWHNRQLWSVLREGASSPYAQWFDVDLDHPDGLLMPVLGDRIGSVLARGEISVDSALIPGEEDSGEQPVLRYFDHVFPIAEGTESLPLSELLERQHYRLAYWRVADEELNYRRFFDVGTLAAVRVEIEEVFHATHKLLIDLFDEGHIDGFRIDHPDGLADPRGYFRRLYEATGGAWTVAEKILEYHEDLPDDWPVAGTTGYDAAWRITALVTEPSGIPDLGAIMHNLTDDGATDFPGLALECKRQIVSSSLFAEIRRLATLVAELCHDDIRLRDHTYGAIEDCLSSLVVNFDRYRAYVVPGEHPAPAAEHAIHTAVAAARRELPAERHDTLEVIEDLLLGKEVGSAGRTGEARRAEVIIRFQQTCGAVMAKGVEDTAFYRWTRLLSSCEVGSSPAHPTIAPDDLHAWAKKTTAAWPATMTLGTTHDTKRGEDVRARLATLSEYPDAWRETLRLLREEGAVEHRPANLDGRAENLLFQTLAGVWAETDAMTSDRLIGYLRKACREQKTWTNWSSPDVEREEELFDYARALLTDARATELLTDFARQTASATRNNILVTKGIALTLLGVADSYQGCEITRTSLVDPDNRRPVNFAHCAHLLERLDAGQKPEGIDEEKLWLTSRILRLRTRHAAAFTSAAAGYASVPTTSGHAFAFARTLDDVAHVVTVGTLRSRRLADMGGWADHKVVLPEGTYRDVLTGAEFSGDSELADLLDTYPIAVLERIDLPADQAAPNTDKE